MHPSVDEGPRRASATEAPVVVLLHGQPGTAGDWYRVVPLLSADHRVIAVDRPGYAGDPTKALDWTGNTDALLQLLDRLRLEQVVLVGASWAGGVAIQAAIRAPERVAGLVLVASVGGDGALTRLDRLTAFRPVLGLGARVAQHTGVGLTGPLLRASGSRLDEQALREARLSLAVWRDRKVWTAAAREQLYLVRDDAALRAAVPYADVPAVVMQGTRDLTLPRKAGYALARALPHARLVTLPAGHILAYEEPLEVAAAIRSLTAAPRPTPEAQAP